MALLQISEPDSRELAGTKELKAVIGIDLGTTNSLVGYVDGQDATVKICLDDDGNALIKSAVTYQPVTFLEWEITKLKRLKRSLYCQICKAIDW